MLGGGPAVPSGGFAMLDGDSVEVEWSPFRVEWSPFQVEWSSFQVEWSPFQKEQRVAQRIRGDTQRDLTRGAILFSGKRQRDFANPSLLCYTWQVMRAARSVVRQQWDERDTVRRISDNGVVYYQFESLLCFVDRDEVRHGVFTRLGGVSAPPFATLNAGHTVGDAPAAVAENQRRICGALGVEAASIASGYQVHGVEAAVLGRQDCGRVRPAADILLTDRPGVPLVQRFADCAPLVLYDPVRRVLGLAHAGWRGAVQGVALAAVQAMSRAFGSRPADVVAGVGPSIGPCCYEIGPEVAAQVRAGFAAGERWLLAQAGGAVHLDLWAANRDQLRAAGVAQVEAAGLCTACHSGEFFSHRAEKGRTGRFGVLAVMGR
jgi:YfiH family protein